MATCPKCGFELPEGALECPACGVVLAKVHAAGSEAIGGGARTTPAAPLPLPAPPAPPTMYGAASPNATIPGTLIGPSHATVESLIQARPWILFLAIYGYVALGFCFLGGIAMLFLGSLNPGLRPLSLVYLLYGVVGFLVVMPLHRSAKALAGLPLAPAGPAVERFAEQQLAFWRRSGILTLVALVITLFVLGMAILFGARAAAG